jgi:hypothetical protein
MYPLHELLPGGASRNIGNIEAAPRYSATFDAFVLNFL